MVAVAVGLTLVAPAEGGVIYATGFEDPPFIVGALNGQDGWTAASSTVVQAGVWRTGTQAAQFQLIQSANLQRSLGLTGLDQLLVEGYLYRDVVGNPVGGFQITLPGLGFMNLHGSGAISTNATGQTAAGTFPFEAWTHFVLDFDIPAETFDVRINGTTAVNDAAFLAAFSGAVTDVLLQRSGANDTNDLFYLDDFQVSAVPVSAEPVPEPASVLLVGVGAFGLLRKTRRRK